MNKYLKNLDRIEFVVTMNCTGRCRHCSEGSHFPDKRHIDGAIASYVIEKVTSVYDIRSVMTFGGEPLLYLSDVSAIHKAAKMVGIPRREIITNGFFTNDKEKIASAAYLLADSGVTRVMLSVDAFHQETIPIEPVFYFAECIRASGVVIELHPAWLVSREDINPYNDRTRQLLDSFSNRGFDISDGNVIFPKGNALIHLAAYFNGNDPVTDPYEESSDDIHSLCIGHDGSVLQGNINTDDILDIIKNYEP